MSGGQTAAPSEDDFSCVSRAAAPAAGVGYPAAHHDARAAPEGVARELVGCSWVTAHQCKREPQVGLQGCRIHGRGMGGRGASAGPVYRKDVTGCRIWRKGAWRGILTPTTLAPHAPPGLDIWQWRPPAAAAGETPPLPNIHTLHSLSGFFGCPAICLNSGMPGRRAGTRRMALARPGALLALPLPVAARPPIAAVRWRLRRGHTEQA